MQRGATNTWFSVVRSALAVKEAATPIGIALNACNPKQIEKVDTLDKLKSLIDMEMFPTLTRFPVEDVWAAMKDPQVVHNRTFIEYEHPTEGAVRTVAPPMHFSETPAGVHLPPPLLGEHNDAVLGGDLGLTRSELDKLAADGVIGTRAVAQ